MKSLSDKDEIMNRLSNRLKYLACDVGERERKLNSAKAKYLSESMDYQNSQIRRGRRNAYSYMMNDRSYQMPPHYNPGGLWPGTRGALPLAMGMPPWNMLPPPQNLKYPMPKRRPSQRRNVPPGQWAVCWNFNSARGCPRGTSCPWRHQKYSTNGNKTGKPSGDGTNEALTNVGQSRREVVQAQSRSRKETTPEIENKKQDDGATEVLGQIPGPSKSPPAQWTPNIKARDIDTDSKMEQKTPVRVNYEYKKGKPSESDTDESGVE